MGTNRAVRFWKIRRKAGPSRHGNAVERGTDCEVSAPTPDGNYTGFHMYSDHWTSTEIDGKLINRSMVWFTLHPGKNKIYKKLIAKDWGFSIRLIKE